MKHLLTAATLLLATIFSVTAKAQKLSDADLKAVSKFYEQMMTAFGKADAAAIANYYTENGSHVSPEGQIITGRPALKEFYQRLFSWFKTLPQPDKTDLNQTNWNTRYLGNDLILVNYKDEQTDHYGKKTEKTVFAMTVILKKTGDGFLCEQVSMTPVKNAQ